MLKYPYKLKGVKTMKEIWRQSIVENYEISNLGRIRNLKTNHIITPEKEEKGYCRLSIRVNGVKKHYAVHRLVAIAFIPNPENKPQIDHIDNNKENNRVDNLRWVSNKENAYYRWERIRRALEYASGRKGAQC